MNVQRYRSKVAELILQADLESVSSKAIRRQIETLEKISLSNVKEEFNVMVKEEYDRITDEMEQRKQAQQQSAPTINGFGLALPPTSLKSAPAAAAPSTKKRPKKQSSSDEEEEEEDSDDYSSVDEGDSKRSKTSASKKKTTKTASKKKDDKKSKKTTEKKKRAPATNKDGTPKVNALTRPQIISPTLASVVGGSVGASGQPEMSRAQVVKQLWVYIKANNLQDPEDKKVILCDPKMRAIFGVDRVGCFEMNKYLGSHFTKIED